MAEPLQTTDSGGEIIKNIIKDYRCKSAALTKAANKILYAIVIILVIGISLFVFAGFLTESTLKYKKEKNDLRIATFDQIVNALENSKSNGMSPNSIQADNLREIQKLQKDLHNESNKISDESLLVFFSTLSTRIGSILIIIFLVQILIRLYRYNTRLSAYYEARANAFEIHLVDLTLPFEKVVNFLSPDLYDISSPKFPTESAISLIQKAAYFSK